MIVLVGALALAWRARYEPGSRPRVTDRVSVWSVRALAPLGALTIFAGTAATAAGPHAGGRPHEKIHRLHFRGADTLNWVIHQHATVAALLGLAALAVWVIVRRRGADSQLQRATTALVVLLGVQGGVGALQFALELPAEIVWVHVALAALTWLAVLWTTAAAGRLPPPAAPERGEPLPLERAERPPAGVPG
jgi:cytochrome c oxidase assembly protein subunit 15